MQNEMKEQNTVQEFTYLSKTNISQTVLFLKEAQSYLQQQYTKELFEQPTKEDFLATTNAIYYENYILNEFVKALKECETSIEQAIGFYTQMQQTFHFGDIYDAVENAFCTYLLSTRVDIETFVDSTAKTALQNHYNEVRKCYSEIVLFVKSNQI